MAGEGLSGAAQTGWLILGRSGAFLLLLICIAAFLLPIILGILFYANTVSTRMAALQKQREDEYRTNEERRNLLLSDLAHDLRTPIMTISGYSRAINDGMVKDAAQQHEYLDAIERKSSRMAELIDILFEFTKLGSQGFKLDLADCDINALLAESAATLYSDIEEAGMELDVDIPDEPFTASADRIHTTRLFSNLIINAVRHNPAGTRILIKANRLAGAEYITFADSGVLIEKDIETLFVPFAKGDSSRAGGGSGLGLSIVKKITELQGWELKLAQPCGAAPEAGGCEGYTKAFVIKIPEK